MSGLPGPPARVLWTSAGANIGTGFTVTGNSGPWSMADPNRVTAVDLRDVNDLWLTASVAAVAGTTPSLTVSFGVYDPAGNLFNLATLTALTAVGAQSAYIGAHGPTAGTYAVLPQWGLISWTVSGTNPNLTGLISLVGR